MEIGTFLLIGAFILLHYSGTMAHTPLPLGPLPTAIPQAAPPLAQQVSACCGMPGWRVEDRESGSLEQAYAGRASVQLDRLRDLLGKISEEEWTRESGARSVALLKITAGVLLEVAELLASVNSSV